MFIEDDFINIKRNIEHDSFSEEIGGAVNEEVLQSIHFWPQDFDCLEHSCKIAFLEMQDNLDIKGLTGFDIKATPSHHHHLVLSCIELPLELLEKFSTQKLMLHSGIGGSLLSLAMQCCFDMTTIKNLPTCIERMWKNDLFEEGLILLPLPIKTHILYDVACGLQCLHGQKKPAIYCNLNFLLAENLASKIGDFGLSKSLDKLVGQGLSTKFSHMPPEALEFSSIYNDKIDVYSFGWSVYFELSMKDDFTNALHILEEFNRKVETEDNIDTLTTFSSLLAIKSNQNKLIEKGKKSKHTITF